MRTIKLNKHERIVAVVPEHVSEPGWSNYIVLVYIADTATGNIRWDTLQPNEQTEAMQTLFTVGSAMAMSLQAAVPTERVKESEG